MSPKVFINRNFADLQKDPDLKDRDLNRLRCVSVSMRTIISAIFFRSEEDIEKSKYSCIQVPLLDLPKEFIIVRCSESMGGMMLQYVIQSQEFESIPLHEDIPEMTFGMKLRAFKLAEEQ